MQIHGCLYIENPKEYTKAPRTNKWDKQGHWSFWCQKLKLIAFLYFNIEQLETESLLKSNTITLKDWNI